MRIRFGFGLPGPFYVTSGGRRRSSGGAAAALLTAVLVGLCFVSWWLALAVFALVGIVVVCVVHDMRHGIPVGRRR